MNSAGSKRETLEVFNYTWPTWLMVLGITAALGITLPILLLILPRFSNWFSQSLDSLALPLATAFGIYGLAGIAISRLLSAQLKRPRMRPSLVAEQDGLNTQWSARVAWNDVNSFEMADAIPSRGPTFQYPCALVMDIGRYRRPVWLSGFSDWKPTNAFPVIQFSKVGYLVRRNGASQLEQVSEQALIAELNNFHAGIKKG